MTPYPDNFMDNEDAPITLAQPPPRKVNIRDWQMSHPAIFINGKPDAIGGRADWEALLQAKGEPAMDAAYLACQAEAKGKPVFYDAMVKMMHQKPRDPWDTLSDLHKLEIILFTCRAGVKLWETIPAGTSVADAARMVMGKPDIVERLKAKQYI